MIRLSDLLSGERVSCNVPIGSKKRVLEQLAALMAPGQSKVSENEIFDSLLARERLGSTGLGRGVAIPHGRVKGGTETIGAFLRLSEGVDFDAPDRERVDLLFALLVPEESTEEHLQLLATLAQMFSDTNLLRKLRETNDSAALLRLITQWSPGP